MVAASNVAMPHVSPHHHHHQPRCRAHTSVLMALNSSRRSEKAVISVGHTNVKSAQRGRVGEAGRGGEGGRGGQRPASRSRGGTGSGGEG